MPFNIPPIADRVNPRLDREKREPAPVSLEPILCAVLNYISRGKKYEGNNLVDRLKTQDGFLEAVRYIENIEGVNLQTITADMLLVFLKKGTTKEARGALASIESLAGEYTT